MPVWFFTKSPAGFASWPRRQHWPPVGAVIAAQPTVPLTFVLAAVVALAHMAFLVNLSTLIVDVFPNASSSA